MPSIKRLIFKKFGGPSNFILFVLLTIVVYLLVRNYMFEDNDSGVEDISVNVVDERIADGIKLAGGALKNKNGLV